MAELKDFIISLDLSKKKVDEIRYDQKNGRLNIYITPKDRNLTVEDFEFSPAPESTPAPLRQIPAGSEKSLKIIGILLRRLTHNAKRKIYLTYLKEEELKD